jgi:hypothetical protein
MPAMRRHYFQETRDWDEYCGTCASEFRQSSQNQDSSLDQTRSKKKRIAQAFGIKLALGLLKLRHVSKCCNIIYHSVLDVRSIVVMKKGFPTISRKTSSSRHEVAACLRTAYSSLSLGLPTKRRRFLAICLCLQALARSMSFLSSNLITSS